MEKPKQPGSVRPFPPAKAPDQKTEITRPVSLKGLRPSGLTEDTKPVVKPAALETDGMKARRREIERRKRAAALEKMHREDERHDSRKRIQKAVFWGALVVIVVISFWRLQVLHGNQWPIMDTWVTIAVALSVWVGWILWYFNRGDY